MIVKYCPMKKNNIQWVDTDMLNLVKYYQHCPVSSHYHGHKMENNDLTNNRSSQETIKKKIQCFEELIRIVWDG